MCACKNRAIGAMVENNEVYLLRYCTFHVVQLYSSTLLHFRVKGYT